MLFSSFHCCVTAPNIMFRFQKKSRRHAAQAAAARRAPSDEAIDLLDSDDDDARRASASSGGRSRPTAAGAAAAAGATSARAYGNNDVIDVDTPSPPSRARDVFDIRSPDVPSERASGKAPVAAAAGGDDVIDVTTPSPNARRSSNKRGFSAGSSGRPRFISRNTSTPSSIKRLGNVLTPLAGGNNKQQSSPKKKSPLERGAGLKTRFKEKFNPSQGDQNATNIVQRYRDCDTIPKELRSKYGDTIRSSLEGSPEMASIKSVLQSKDPPIEFFYPDSLSRNVRDNGLCTMTGNFASLDSRYDDRALENRDHNGELGPFFKEIFNVLGKTAE